MQTRIKRPSPALVVAIIALVAALTGTAWAALGKNSVGAKQLKKNAVVSTKIKNSAVTASKIAQNAVGSPKIQDGSVTTSKVQDSSITTNKLKDGAVTGAKVDLSSLGTVPSASTAETASSLAGQQSFFIRLNGGQSQTVASNGSVSLLATCDANLAGNDRVRVLAQTSLSGAILNGVDNLSGPGGSGEFLEPATVEEKREFLSFSDTTGDIDVSSNIDQGYVLGPDGKMITANSEGIALGLNYGGSTCLVAGIVNLIG